MRHSLFGKAANNPRSIYCIFTAPAKTRRKKKRPERGVFISVVQYPASPAPINPDGNGRDMRRI